MIGLFQLSICMICLCVVLCIIIYHIDEIPDIINQPIFPHNNIMEFNPITTLTFDIFMNDELGIKENSINNVINGTPIQSDSENVHDSLVNKITGENIDILLKCNYELLETNILLNEIGRFIRYQSSIKFSQEKILDIVDTIILLPHPLAFSITPMEAFKLSWARASDKRNKSNSINIKESILSSLLDPSHNCAHGYVVSLIGLLIGLDLIGDLIEIKSMPITKRVISEQAGIIIKKLINNFINNSGKTDKEVINYFNDIFNNKDISKYNIPQSKLSKFNDELRNLTHKELNNMYGEEYKYYISDINTLFNYLI